MSAQEKLGPYRKEFADALSELLRMPPATQNSLIAEHVRAAGDLVSGPLCLAIGDALGVPHQQRRAAALAAGLVELAAASTMNLGAGDGTTARIALDNGYPLALNAMDALYSLAHLALLDMAGDIEGLERVATGSVDFPVARGLASGIKPRR